MGDSTVAAVGDTGDVQREGDQLSTGDQLGEASMPRWSRVLAVCAHPDDESFGLGALLSTLSGRGTVVSVLCFTHGEASTLGGTTRNLAQVRAAEFAAAAEVLGVRDAELLDHPDGGLAMLPPGLLADEVQRTLRRSEARALLVFDEGGVTGHPDHQRATAAAARAADRADLDLLAWVIPANVAATLNAEFAAGFIGRPAREIDLTLSVDRTAQLEAISCHHSQAADNPVLWRRLQLLGETERLRYLRRRRQVRTEWGKETT